MEREQITRMAREAGLPIFDATIVARNSAEQAMADIVTKAWHDSAERFFQLAYEAGAKDEREACARVCEESNAFDWPECAAAIRARGNK